MEIHKKTSPQCPLVEILDYSKEWVRNPTEDQTYEPISSHLLKSRIETYSNWWPHTYPNITPERVIILYTLHIYIYIYIYFFFFQNNNFK